MEERIGFINRENTVFALLSMGDLLLFARLHLAWLILKHLTDSDNAIILPSVFAHLREKTSVLNPMLSALRMINSLLQQETVTD